MKFTIAKQEENALLGRIEVTGTIMFDGATPTRQKVKAAVASAIKAKPDLVMINRIEGSFGRRHATVEAVAYSSAKDLERIEREHIRKRNAKEEKPAEEAPAEKPAEEKAEEAVATEAKPTGDAPADAPKDTAPEEKKE